MPDKVICAVVCLAVLDAAVATAWQAARGVRRLRKGCVGGRDGGSEERLFWGRRPPSVARLLCGSGCVIGRVSSYLVVAGVIGGGLGGWIVRARG